MGVAEPVARRQVRDVAALFAALEAELQREKSERAADADRMGEMLMRIATVETENKRLGESLKAATERAQRLESERDRAAADARTLATEAAGLQERARRAESQSNLAALELERAEVRVTDSSDRIAALEAEAAKLASRAVRPTVHEALRASVEALEAENARLTADQNGIEQRARAESAATLMSQRELMEAHAVARQNDAAAILVANQARVAAEAARDAAEKRAREATTTAEETLKRVRDDAANRALSDSRRIDELVELEAKAKAELELAMADATEAARIAQGDLRAASAAAAEAHALAAARERELTACRAFLEELVRKEQEHAVVRIDALKRAIEAIDVPRGPSQQRESKRPSRPPAFAIEVPRVPAAHVPSMPPVAIQAIATALDAPATVEAAIAADVIDVPQTQAEGELPLVGSPSAAIPIGDTQPLDVLDLPDVPSFSDIPSPTAWAAPPKKPRSSRTARPHQRTDQGFPTVPDSRSSKRPTTVPQDDPERDGS